MVMAVAAIMVFSAVGPAFAQNSTYDDNGNNIAICYNIWDDSPQINYAYYNNQVNQANINDQQCAAAAGDGAYAANYKEFNVNQSNYQSY